MKFNVPGVPAGRINTFNAFVSLRLPARQQRMLCWLAAVAGGIRFLIVIPSKANVLIGEAEESLYLEVYLSSIQVQGIPPLGEYASVGMTKRESRNSHGYNKKTPLPEMLVQHGFE